MIKKGSKKTDIQNLIMKKLLFCFILLSSLVSHGQMYNNEWIDHNKTYYKFKSGLTGLHRISQAILANAGLGAVPAEHFQLWRNGVELPLHVTVSTGTLGASDYIEFWGEMNDGKPDKELYKQADHQLNDRWSLETDQATYFLTVNPAGGNKRFAVTANNVAGNTLPAEPWFMHTAATFYRDRLNGGWALDVGEYLYASTYDKGEGWTSNAIDSLGLITTTHNNLQVYTSGPDATITYHAAGLTIHPRRVGLRVNDVVIDTLTELHYFNYIKPTFTVPIGLISTNMAKVQFDNIASAFKDYMVVAQFELKYPRQFNFGGASNFTFTMPASTTPKYLEIKGFSYSTIAPVLYDLTNNRRYTTDIGTAGTVKVVLEPSATESKLVMVGQFAPVIGVSSFQTRNFINYANAANQGNYLIITSDRLYNSSGANPIEDYRAYRSSTAGGGHNAKIYFVDELTDQFAFGIHKHPVALRNFLLYARHTFQPKFVFFVGKGVDYYQQFFSAAHPDMEKLNLVPTFGRPASDALLSANKGESVPQIPFGRLSVINTQEIAAYLDKVKETERAQANVTPYRADREWMKNVVHLNGIGDEALRFYVDEYFRKYKKIISDTLYGGKVSTFEKTTNDAVQQISSHSLDNLFREGISIMTYFGHSASNTLEFNLESPQAYDNKGKYPFFIALGCNAGNFFNFNTVRFISDETISEKFVLAKDRGTIGFIASTHFGIPYYLDKWNTVFYEEIAAGGYGSTIGELIVSTAKKMFNPNNINDFPAMANIEETAFHGDPALKVFPHAKPDYVIDDALVKVAPNFISIADTAFEVKAKFVNIGRAINRDIVVELRRQYPNGQISVIRDTIPGIRYADSLSFRIPIDPQRDKGANKITIMVEADGIVDELYESNNTVSRDVFIYEDEVRPVYPYNLSIVSDPLVKLVASTANAFSAGKQYVMELDTTQLFNSPLKISRTVTSAGGVVEFDPGIAFNDNTVYYWRTAMVPTTGGYNWNDASFIYLSGHAHGFNQSHLYQHFRSSYDRIQLDSASSWNYNYTIHNLFGKNGVYPYGGNVDGDFTLAVDGTTELIRSACVGRSLVFNVFDYYSFKPWKNTDDNGNSLFRYGSGSASCAKHREYNFEFSYMTAAGRKKIMDFMDVIPQGSYVAVRSFDTNDPNSFSATWRSDTALYGSGNSLYHKLLDAGFTLIDSINKPRAWILIYQKGKKDMEAKMTMTEGIFDKVTLSADCPVPNQSGMVTSPKLGPAKAWKNFEWAGQTVDPTTGDKATVDILGYRVDGTVDTLYQDLDVASGNVDISATDASIYPYLQMQLTNTDSVHHTAYQLSYWRLTYDPVPEGALAPNLYVSMADSVDVGQPAPIKIAFKNVTPYAFDSLRVKLVLTDANNVPHVLPIGKFRPLAANDSLHITYELDTRNFEGLNNLFIDVNPDNDQPEQFHFNNFAFKNLFVRGDSLNPLLDVTFDNVHILNNDVVSPTPEIMIKLKDESKWGLLDTSSLVSVKLRKLPGGALRTYQFDNDTLRFTPAGSVQENTATVHFYPAFPEDGKYELTVGGKDKRDNKAAYEYRVTFEVINKAMISNMLNYPNPFTTSTAFVFTLTGSEVPQELKIQILTVTGKVVREITKQELGPLRIGRNITEFKWDGTDQYGQKLANGVYLYRVVTSTHGKRLEKYKSDSDKTDQYFNKGYGKMYLMR